ncbi:ABC transporter ATP-binding protein [Viridibacillus sp. YIM B01967]|uniref:ABC transporter ATP-binding protein n=2 Tax=Viridibacillus soli TaxID=2798301 RepID=A0ABS1H931_9BACL|nr:ABC transporter ATP-binding protein [Viridibacillus soli]
MTVIQCENLEKKFRKKKALQNITFQIEGEKITGLIGRNGTGKTTLLRILAGMTKQTSGTVTILDKTPFNNLFVSANSILINDQMQFPGSFKLQDILNFAPDFYEKWDAELATRLLQYFRLSPQSYHSDLSKGMKNTFNFIFGLATRCTVTMFDEPINGMDEAVRKDVYRALLKDYLAYPRTIIISSHFLDEMEHLLEDILLLDEGKVALHKSLDELREHAIGLQGPADVVKKWATGFEILHEKQLAGNQLYTVLKAQDCTFNEKQLLQEGISFIPVSAGDLCLYLTNTRVGGIDDVFND